MSKSDILLGVVGADAKSAPRELPEGAPPQWRENATLAAVGKGAPRIDGAALRDAASLFRALDAAVSADQRERFVTAAASRLISARAWPRPASASDSVKRS